MEDEDFDDHLDTLLVAYKKGSKWVVIGAVFELIGDFFRMFAKFFDVCMDASLTKFKYERQQQEFQQQASREIEMLTSGDHDASSAESSGSFGTRGAE